jgi:hypothetical protein
MKSCSRGYGLVRFAPLPNFSWIVSIWVDVRSATSMPVMCSFEAVGSGLYTMVSFELLLASSAIVLYTLYFLM